MSLDGAVGLTETIMMAGIVEMFGHSAPVSRVAGILPTGYFLGCFTAGYYLVRWRSGQDIRELGSGSVGARNVGRVLGMAGFLATTLSDFGKGALAVWIARNFIHDPRVTGLTMLAVVIGHIWPLQLGFRGGKGVATSLGALAVYDLHLAAAYGVLCVGFLIALRRTTLSGLLAFAFLPLAAMFLAPEPDKAVMVSILAGMILFAHRKNLVAEFNPARRLADKMEPPTK